MKLNHKLIPIKIPLLFVIFSLSFFVIDSTFINLYAAGPGGKMIISPKSEIGINSLTGKDLRSLGLSPLARTDLSSLTGKDTFDYKSSLTGKDTFDYKSSLTGKDTFDYKSSLTGKDLGSLASHFPYSKNIKYSKPEIKNEIEKKLEKIKLNKPNLYTEQKTNSLYNANLKNFNFIVNYVRAFANFIIVIPQMLNYR
jgi:hypothetical protein